eukprot:jgi/Botrbrau1/7298/Bobra.0318s0030.1
MRILNIQVPAQPMWASRVVSDRSLTKSLSRISFSIPSVQNPSYRIRTRTVTNVAAPPNLSSAAAGIAVLPTLGEGIRADFPILHQEVNGKPLVYLDNGATSQKPEVVLQALDTYNRQYNSNVHRGVHYLAAKATTAYEEGREKVARFIGANPREIVFTKNASEAINLVAHAWGTHNLKPGDEGTVPDILSFTTRMLHVQSSSPFLYVEITPPVPS